MVVSLEVRGLFSDKETYKALDIVALNGGSFVARRDDPGPCPGAGWQLIASQGKRGDKASARCRAFRASRSSSRSGGSTATTTGAGNVGRSRRLAAGAALAI
jgi:hypothetical protein